MRYPDEEQKRCAESLNLQNTRSESIKQIFNLINAHDMISRIELAQITGFSPSTVSSMVDSLLREELIIEVGFSRMISGAGRRPIILRINPASRQIPVFTLDHYGVTYTLFDLSYSVIERSFHPRSAENVRKRGFSNVFSEEARANGEEFIRLIEDILRTDAALLDLSRVPAVLVCIPGVYQKKQSGFYMTPIPAFIGEDSVNALEQMTGRSAIFGNTSMSLAYAEKKYLERHGKATDDLIYVNICNGVGAGIVSDGRLLINMNRPAGDIGHIRVEPNGLPCPCGRCGCLEQYLNVSAINAAVQRAFLASADDIGAVYDRIGNVTLEKIGSAYSEGMSPVTEVMDDLAEKLFIGIDTLVCITGIQRVVIGGIDRLGSAFLNKLRSFIGRGNLVNLGLNITIDTANTGTGDAGRGMAEYFIDHRFRIGSE